MTIKQSKRTFLFIFLLTSLFGVNLRAQQKDFGTWWELKVDKGFKNGINLSGELEQRFDNNSLSYDRTLLTFSGDYDVLEYLNVGAGIRNVFITDRESRLHTRLRFHADATGQYLLSSWDFSLRLRFQYGFEDLYFIGYLTDVSFISRQKLKVAHHFFGTRFGFLTSIENWIHFEDQNKKAITKIRFTLGGEYDLSYRSSLGLRYILENEFNVTNPYQSHILVFNFSYDL